MLSGSIQGDFFTAIATALGSVLVAFVFRSAKRALRWAREKGEEISNTCETIPKLYDELHQQGAAMRILLQNGSYGTFICDKEGSNIEVNDNYCRMLGALRHELTGNGWENFVSLEERERYEREWAPAMKSRREYSAELTFTRKDRSQLKTLVRTVKLFDRHGDTIGYYGFITPQPKTP